MKSWWTVARFSTKFSSLCVLTFRQINVYAKLAKIKNIKPVDYGYNIVKWHSAMESKHMTIEQKVPGSYHESQYIMDYLDASMTSK
jgi:hypothetical protein